jgi:KDO2-lipid IV(A) lauroyltransferase
MGGPRYYIYCILNWVIALLPLPVLYVFSDFLFLFFYYFPSYRRKDVAINLHNSFPEKSEKELRTIEKKFYHHLADMFVETLKLAHLPRNHLMRRMTLSNPELLSRLFNEGRDIAAVVAHYNNWEWLQSVIYYTDYRTNSSTSLCSG